MYMTPSVCDLRGGSPNTAEVGSKQWIDCIMSGLASRQLKPPVQQIRMLIQNEATVGRLQKAQNTKQQLDIICGAAFKAKLAWQKTSEPQPKDVTSETETWRLRPRDWKICKPAVTEQEDVVGDRVDAFRSSVDGDPLSQLWSRRSGAFFVSAGEAARVIRSVPIHKPPAGLYTLVTLEPTARSEATPVETVVLFQDGSPHMQKVFLTQLGTERLTHGTWKTVSLVAVETVEVLLEWWKDLCQGEDLDCFLGFEKFASAVASASGSKGKGKGHGKSKNTSASVKIPDSLITDINAKLGDMLGDSPATWKTFGHSIRDGIIRATVRLPKAVALRWLSQGTQHQAILARDISEFSDVADFRKVWVNVGCPVLDGTPVEIRQSLKLYLADVKASWAVIRTPYRWGVRVHKDHEREVKSILQPHAVYVPEGHVKFRIQNVPKSLDPEVLVATLTSQEFKPYLVVAHKTAVVIAAPLPPPDIVFVIQDLGVTLLLEPLSVPTVSAAPVPSHRHTEDASPKRKARKPEESSGQQGVDTRGGAVSTHNRFGVLGEDEYPPLPQKPTSTCAGILRDLTNFGNTCFVAAAVRCVAHIVCHSQLARTVLVNQSLARLVFEPSLANWKAFLRSENLVNTEQQDCALFLQKLVEQEPSCRSLLATQELLGVECVGCQEPKTIDTCSHICRLTAPATDAATLQELVSAESQVAESELEVTCECCFAEHAEPKTKAFVTNEWLLIQLLRANPDDSKRHTPVELVDSLRFADQSWELHLVVCHAGKTASQGHYTLLSRSLSDGLDKWTLFDDGQMRPGSSSETTQIPSRWTLALFRLVKSPCSVGGVKSPCLVPSSTLPADNDNAASPKPDVPVCSAQPPLLSHPVSSSDNGMSTSLCCHGPDCVSQVSHLVSLVQSLETRLAVLETALQRSPVPSCQDGHVVPGPQEAPPVSAAPSCVVSSAQAHNVVEPAGVSMSQALGSLPCVSSAPPSVLEPGCADKLPAPKSRAVVQPCLAQPGAPAGQFARSANPAIVAELARLCADGFHDVAWIFERLHSDALLLPLAHLARDTQFWKLLGDILVYNCREVQSQIQAENIKDPGLQWIVLRLLQRGRYNRFVNLKDGGRLDLLQKSVQVCEVPTWWSPPWLRSVAQSRSAQSRGRPLLPCEWTYTRKRAASPVERTCQQSCSALSLPQAPSPPVQPRVRRRKKGPACGSGDVKGGSSSFRLMAMNVTSLFSRVACLCALTFSVALVSETALTSRGQDILTKYLQQNSRCVLWGAPVPGARGGVSSSKGVAIVGGPGVQLIPLDIPEDLTSSFCDGRIVAGKVRLQSSNFVTCVSCYAHDRDIRARENLLSKAVDWILSLKGHVILGGDLNTELSSSLALMRLMDHGFHPVNSAQEITCCTYNSLTGTVIDHVFLSPSLRPALLSSHVMSAAPFPTHKPVVADLDVAATCDTWEVLRAPRSFPVNSDYSETAALDGSLDDDFADIQALVDAGCTDEAYSLWTAVAEKELACQCRRQGRPISSMHFGRAAEIQLKRRQLHKQSVKGDEEFRRLEKARSGLAELCTCWDICVGRGLQQNIWNNACRRLRLVDGPWPNLPATVPCQQDVQHLLDLVRSEINKRNGRSRHRGLQEWRSRMVGSQAQRFRWAKENYVSWQSIPDTPATFRKIEEMWQPILCRPVATCCKVDSVDPVSLSSRLVGSMTRLDLLSISGEQLRQAVTRVPIKSSCGADGWRRHELLALAPPFWDSLSVVLQNMASAGRWHSCLRTVVTSLIPKKAGVNFVTNPAGLRPISVCSLVYRAWSGVLAKRLHAVLELSLPSCSHGFRAGESAQSAMAATFLSLQNASLEGQHVHLVTYDICKCFDSLPWQAVSKSLQNCGVNQQTAAALLAMWTNLRRIWKLQGRFQTSSFSPSNGLFQGDPSAPACLAAFLCHPINTIRQKWPSVSISQYADDILFSCNNPGQLHEAHCFFVQWLCDQNVDLNAQKCYWASTCSAPDLPTFWVGNVQLRRTAVLETLGGHFSLPGTGDPPVCVGNSDHWEQNLQKFFSIVRRFACLDVGYELRSTDLGALMSMLTYSAVAWDSRGSVDNRQQRTIVNMLAGGKVNTRRCLEVCLGLLSPIHRSSIPEALLHEQVSILYRLLNTNADFQQVVRSHFDLCSNMRDPPPTTFFVRFQRALQEYGWEWISWSQLKDRQGRVYSLLATTIEKRRIQTCQLFAKASTVDELMFHFFHMTTAHREDLWACQAPALHALRDDMRWKCFHKAGVRRRDMKDLEYVDRKILTQALQKTPQASRPILRFIMQGAVMTADRVHRSSRGGLDATCPFCLSGVEDETHRYWQCEHWQHVRIHHFGDNAVRICSQMQAVSNVASLCGIPTSSLSDFLVSHWLSICACMIDIHARANGHDR